MSNIWTLFQNHDSWQSKNWFYFYWCHFCVRKSSFLIIYVFVQHKMRISIKKNLVKIVKIVLDNDYPLNFIFNIIRERIKILINKKTQSNHQ